MTDIAFLPARKLAKLIADRDLGCLELLDYMIARVEKHDGRVNAVVVRDFDRARSRARELDRMRKPLGKLHGVAMTVKESYDIAGLPTTWGVAEKREQIAARSAVVVDRLMAAGAVIFGKTNVPAMLNDWQSFNPIYGSTGNPWDLSRSPGGSSGGAAAALAAGLTCLEAGSDIGGSIRQPAHACGVFGHKPTWSLVPTRGHAPVPGVAGMLDITVVGPLARSAADLAIALDIVAGPEETDTALRYKLPPPAHKHLKGMRIAVWAEDPATHTDGEITAALHDLSRHLRGEGATVDLGARPAFDPRDAYEVYLKLLSAAINSRAPQEHVERMNQAAAELAPDDNSTVATQLRAVAPAHAEWLNWNEKRHRIRRAWGTFFQDWDVLLCPVLSVPAQPRMEDRPPWELTTKINGATVPWPELLFWPGLVGGFHLPASVAPLGLTKAGLPIGVQIVGPLYGDRTTLAFARLLERSWRAFEAPAGWL
jgi:amidase